MNILNIIFLVTTCLVAKSFAGPSLPAPNLIDRAFVDELIDAPLFHHIVIRQNISYILNRELKSNEKNLIINNINVTSEHQIPIRLFFQSDDTFYFMTTIDHESRLEVQFKYNINNRKNVNVKFGYHIRKRKLNFRFEPNKINASIQQISMIFKNVNFEEYRDNEGRLIGYFNNSLANYGITVMDVEEIKDREVLVTLGLDEIFSRSTTDLISNTCPQILDDNFKKQTGLELKPCSMEIHEKVFNVSNFKTNIVTINSIVSADRIGLNNSVQININFILISIVIFLQLWLLV